METLLVINGESYWQDFLPEFHVVQKKVQSTEWLLRDGRLFAADQDGVCSPDRILWRVGAIRPEPRHRTALEMIRISGVHCVNAAHTLLQGYDRLSMLQTLRHCGLPTIPFNVVTTSTLLKQAELPFPFVVKAGNLHGGFGKVLVDSPEQWQDIRDLLFVTEDYITVEPFIDYARDIRYLAIGASVWAMARKGRFWKANVETTDYALIAPEPALAAQLKHLHNYLGADILAIDILEENNGQLHVVEYNDIPGLTGFPDAAQTALAECVRGR